MDKDVISKDLLKRLLLQLARQIFHLPLREADLVETARQRVEERRSDLTARVVGEDRSEFLLHVEIQNDNDPHMVARMLRYLSDLRFAHPNLEVRQYVLYIGQAALRMPEGLASTQIRYHYPVIDMRRIDYTALLAADSPDASVLAVLGDFRDDPPRQAVRNIVEHLLRQVDEGTPGVRDYLLMLDTLAQNRGLNRLVQEIFEMLTVEVEKLAIYGMGKKAGLQEGVAAERSLLLRLIERRFGPATADSAVPLLAPIQSAEIFETIGEWVLDSASAEVLLERLRSVAGSPEEKRGRSD